MQASANQRVRSHSLNSGGPGFLKVMRLAARLRTMQASANQRVRSHSLNFGGPGFLKIMRLAARLRTMQASANQRVQFVLESEPMSCD